MNILKRLYKGMRYSEKYGHHPGTGLMLTLPVLGALAGIDRGIPGMIFGVSVMLIFVAPMYLVGCYHRGD